MGWNSVFGLSKSQEETIPLTERIDFNKIGGIVRNPVTLLVPSLIAMNHSPIWFTAGLITGIFFSRIEELVGAEQFALTNDYIAVVQPFVQHPVSVIALSFIAYFGEPDVCGFLIGINAGMRIAPYVPVQSIMRRDS